MIKKMYYNANCNINLIKEYEMKIKVMMTDGKYLYVNKVLVEEKTFTVSSAPVELDDESFALCQQFEPKMNFIVEKTLLNVQPEQPHEIGLDFIVAQGE